MKKIFLLKFILILSLIVIMLCLFNIFNFYFLDSLYIDNLCSLVTKKYIPDSNSSLNNNSTNFLEVNFNNLNSINSSTVGWLEVNNTKISYPFVQASDNEYYLTHTFDNSINYSGWVFLDYRNDKNLTDKNTIIYAHSMKNNTMFGSLKNVLSSEWYSDSNNHYIRMSTFNKNLIWQVFSIYTIDTTDDYLKINFNNNNDFYAFYNLLVSRSIYTFNCPFSQNSQILTLSTCYNSNQKLVLHAILINTQIRNF